MSIDQAVSQSQTSDPDSPEPRLDKSPGVRLSGYWILALLLGVALIHGIIYIFIMPPWQHYDEPNHFEYAWIVANLNRTPQPGDYDPLLSRQVVESMIRNGFFDGLDYFPDVSTGAQVGIPGFSQFDEPPLYYLIVSLPLRLLSSESVETQLYAARTVSLLLYLLTVLAAWGIAREITSPASPLRWLLPLAIALLPAFTDLMTALNNDVAAVAVFSCFLWVSVRLLRKGFSWVLLAALLMIAVLAFFTKSTTLIMLPLVFVVLCLLVIPRRWRWTAWLALGVFIVLFAFVALDWGDAALWARSTNQVGDTRTSDIDAPLGDSVFQLQITPADEQPGKIWIAQLLPEQVSLALDRKVVTLGAWMWADRPVQVNAPTLSTYPGQRVFSRAVTLDQEPIFVAYVADLKWGTERVWLTIQPFSERVDEPATVYLDGLLLVEGEYPLPSRPYYYDPDALSGDLDGLPFTNLLRNPSAEDSGIYLKPWLAELGTRIFPDPGVNSLSVTLYTLLDWEAGARYYWGASQRLLRTFWAKFGWGHVPLLGHKPYRPLALVTLIGVLGFIGYAVFRFKHIRWDIALLFGLGILAVWGITLIRGSNYLFVRIPIFYPVARYAYPVIIPTLLLLVTGWISLLHIAGRWFPKITRYLSFLPLVFLLILAVYSLVSITEYYY